MRQNLYVIFQQISAHSFVILWSSNVEVRRLLVKLVIRYSSLGGGEITSPLYSTGLSYSVLARTSWTRAKLEDSLGLGEILDTTDSFSSSEESLATLCSSIHSLLDQLGAPGTFLLTILWLCDFPPPLPCMGAYREQCPGIVQPYLWSPPQTQTLHPG